MTLPVPSVRVLVCGTADRGDDGAAMTAVAHALPRLDPELRRLVEIRRCPDLTAADLIDLRAGEACVVLDTAVGMEAGAVTAMPLEDLTRSNAAVAPRSSHDGPIRDVIETVAEARGEVPRGSLVAIGGHWFGYGARTSRAVRLGLPRLEEALIAEIRRLAGPENVPAARAGATGRARSRLPVVPR
jgi:Ni,Fe-hydrogenase maturation factor